MNSEIQKNSKKSSVRTLNTSSDTENNEEQHTTDRPKTTTSVYIGKKITGIHEFGTKNTIIKSAGFDSTSIDIDTPSNQNKATSTQRVTNKTRVSETNIDTDISIPIQKQNLKSGFPIITEDDSVTIEAEAVPLHKISVANAKDKYPLNQSSLSLDISDNISAIHLPTGSEKEPLGSGVVQGILGAGGMSKVYKIWNEKLEVYRAVKILIPANRSNNTVRFETEAKISAKLHHPNIIEVHSIDEWNSLPFIEMEYIDGMSLCELISNNGALPSEIATSIALGIARALAYAHNVQYQLYGKEYTGILHRDLKPGNVMIGLDGRVKLMDFGVARPLETGIHTMETDRLIGTLQYFSPEQVNGNPIDHSSDIYAFGSILYEMLCGFNPFPYSDVTKLFSAKTKNSFKRLEEYRLPITPAIASVAQTCLRTDKLERFPSAVDLKNTLESVHASFSGDRLPETCIANFLLNPKKIAPIPSLSVPKETQIEEYAVVIEKKPIVIEMNSTQEQTKLLPSSPSIPKSPECIDMHSDNKAQIRQSKIITALSFTLFFIIVAAVIFYLINIGIISLSTNYDCPSPTTIYDAISTVLKDLDLLPKGEIVA